MLVTASSLFALFISSFAVFAIWSNALWASVISLPEKVLSALSSAIFCATAASISFPACVLAPVSFASLRRLSTSASLCAVLILSSNFRLSSSDKPKPPSWFFASLFLFASWTWATPSRASIALLRPSLALSSFSRVGSGASFLSYSVVASLSCVSNGSLVAFDAWVYLTSKLVFNSFADLITFPSSCLLSVTRTLFIPSVSSALLIAVLYGLSCPSSGMP